MDLLKKDFIRASAVDVIKRALFWAKKTKF